MTSIFKRLGPCKFLLPSQVYIIFVITFYIFISGKLQMIEDVSFQVMNWF